MRPSRLTRRPFLPTLALGCLAAAAAAFFAGTAGAADQPILGKVLIVKDPTEGDDPSRRKVLVVAKETGSDNPLVGDPTVDGATLEITIDGATSSAGAFVMPAGVGPTGVAFWRVSGTGFRYKDPTGENGAVRAMRIQRSKAGTFVIKGVVSGKKGPVSLVPPNHGVQAYVVLTIGGGDRYCVQFGPGGVSTSNAKLWRVKQPTQEGCPP